MKLISSTPKHSVWADALYKNLAFKIHGFKIHGGD